MTIHDTYRCVYTTPDGKQIPTKQHSREGALLAFADLVNPSFAALGGKARVRVISEKTWLEAGGPR